MDFDTLYCRAEKFADTLGIEDEKTVLLGLSGGADSVFLLNFFMRYKEAKKLNLICVHVNHHIRQSEAQRDADFCRSPCEKLGVRFILTDCDVPAMCRKKVSEDAARAARYDAFLQAADECFADYIATAHNSDDVVETVLFKLLRGASLRSLGGIPKKRLQKTKTGREIYFIRPILELHKEDIRRCLDSMKCEYVFDSTNNDNDYSRNYLRNTVLPSLKKINSSFGEHITDAARTFEIDEEYIDSDAKKVFGEHYDGSRFPKDVLNACNEAISSRILMKMCAEISDITPSRKNICDALLLAKTSNKAELCFAENIKFVVTSENVSFCRRGENDRGTAKLDKTVFCGDFLPLDDHGAAFYLTKDGGGFEKYKNVYKKYAKAVIDFDKINGELYIKTPRGNEKYRYGNMTHTVKKTMSDKKIDTAKRTYLPELYDDEGIVWLPFCSMRDDVKVTEKTDSQNICNIYYFEK